MTARYTHDFADREATLEIQVGGAAPQAIVTGSSYKPSGPLAALTLGNGLSETRGFSSQYFPSSIEIPGRLLQTYATDPVGNIRGITRTVGTQSYSMAFSYQDPQYFLTQGNGPWGQQSWTYDRIGNRLSEVASSETFTYTYQGGHNPKLSRVQPAPGGEPGSRLDFGYDAAGNQTTAAVTTPESSGWTSFLNYSPESRLSRLSTSNGPSSTDLLYDGRGFLRRSRLTATNTTDFEQTEPVYTSEGLLLARRYHKQSTQGGRGDTGSPPTARVTMNTTDLFYFAGRPVAQLTRPQSGTDTLLYLTTDHLGTPIQATDTSGAIVWEGGLDPFGTPFVFSRQGPSEGGDRDNLVTGGAASTSATMEGAGVFLRFPGQWDDPSFRSHGLSGGVYYNVYRWYQPGTGRYSQPDPLGLRGDVNLFAYARSNPEKYFDSLGLAVQVCCKNIPGTASRVHCYIKIIKGAGKQPSVWTWGLHPPDRDRTLSGGLRSLPCSRSRVTGYVESNDWFDLASYYGDAECGPVDDDPCLEKERCVDREALAYPQASTYCVFGPNSNTFASTITRNCGLTPPSIAKPWKAPGWGDAPPKR